MAAAFLAQFKVRILLNGESQQEFATVVEQLAHRALVRLPVNFIQREAGHAFVNRVRDRELKQHLFIGVNRSIT